MTTEEKPKVNPAEKSYSWFVVLDGPDRYFNGTQEEIPEEAVARWCDGHPARSAIATYCRSPTGMPHLHMVLEDAGMARFSAVKAAFPKAHIEATKGTKSQAEAYIFKEGKFEDSEEEILEVAQRGEIKGRQGHRSDFDRIKELIELGKTYREIVAVDMRFRHYERMIKQEIYDRRFKNTPFKRDIKVFYHVGESRSGKTYSSVKLVERHGEEAIYMMGDYERGGFDNYSEQPILFMDEFRGQMPYAILLKMLDGYKIELGARYGNVMPFWTEVHITSVLPPEKLYSKNQEDDSTQQFLLRIYKVVYHWVDETGTTNDEKYRFRSFTRDEYAEIKDYKDVKEIAESGWSISDYKAMLRQREKELYAELEEEGPPPAVVDPFDDLPDELKHMKL